MHPRKSIKMKISQILRSSAKFHAGYRASRAIGISQQVFDRNADADHPNRIRISLSKKSPDFKKLQIYKIAAKNPPYFFENCAQTLYSLGLGQRRIFCVDRFVSVDHFLSDSFGVFDLFVRHCALKNAIGSHFAI